jgi:hypothetical protein
MECSEIVICSLVLGLSNLNKKHQGRFSASFQETVPTLVRNSSLEDSLDKRHDSCTMCREI